MIEESNIKYKNYIARRTRGRRSDFEEAKRRVDRVCKNKKRKYENYFIDKMDRTEDFRDNDPRESYRYLKSSRDVYKLRTNLCRNKKKVTLKR
ncbi:hypothetical protein GWI33_013358 [Rhynchophorus ferrugineus]|uniref:Uncharacterized protein n=1 Tax=Rhynchophorus ferrugineus TaxID=354439 RepID=A0A834M7Y2_RHYFE|nr:hypothetical protein GWI33_013358 [Rhynchophorus ferrugineus]